MKAMYLTAKSRRRCRRKYMPKTRKETATVFNARSIKTTSTSSSKIFSLPVEPSTKYGVNLTVAQHSAFWGAYMNLRRYWLPLAREEGALYGE